MFLGSDSIPKGAEVPVRVDGPGEGDMTLDWDGYVEIPDRADRAYHLRIENSREWMASEQSE